MEDSFDFIAAEAGTISRSQEERLRRCRFIRQPPGSSPSASPSSSHEEEEEGVDRFRITAHPITMRSASDSSRSSSSHEDHGGDDGEVNGLGDGQVKGERSGRQIRISRKDADAAGSSAEPSKRMRAFSDESTQEPEVVCFSAMKPKGSATGSGLSGRRVAPEIEDRISPAVAQDHAGRDDDFPVAAAGTPKAAARLCKLPPSFDEEADDRRGQSVQRSSPPAGRNALEGGESPEKLLPSESELIELLAQFSKKPDKRLEKVDFLEVLAMKGIHIPPPRWWRPGGYGPL